MAQSSDLLTEPPPQVDDAWCRRVLAQTYGLEATVVALRSERDHNLLVTDRSGGRSVLKVSNSAEDPQIIDMENAAMRHVGAVAPDLAIPRLVPTQHGQTVSEQTAPDGRTHLVRMVTLLPGTAADITAVPVDFAQQLGSWSAQMSVALQGFFHPAAGRIIEWDPRRVGDLAAHVEALPHDRQGQVAELLARAARTQEALLSLPAWVQHGDVTMSNVLVDGSSISGIIDFGDMHHTPRVADVAITLSSMLRVVIMAGGDPWQESTTFLRAYQEVTTIRPDEFAVLGELMLARLAATVLISALRAKAHPDNLNYLNDLDEGVWRCLDVLGTLDPAELAQRLTR